MRDEDRLVVRLLGIGAGVLAVILLIVFSFKIVSPGYRGVKTMLGNVSPTYLSEGPHFTVPFIQAVTEVSIRQETRETSASCFSSDLQQVNIKLKVLYRTPETQVVTLFQKFQGDPFDSLVSPRVQEAIKEVTAGSTAEQIVKQREKIKQTALSSARTKIGELVYVDDIVIENIDLTKELEAAIESKMVQEQEASKSKFTQDKAKVEAETMIIKAKGDAESIRIQGEALKQTPDLIQLKIVEKWDGRTPLVVGSATTNPANILLPINPSRER